MHIYLDMAVLIDLLREKTPELQLTPKIMCSEFLGLYSLGLCEIKCQR